MARVINIFGTKFSYPKGLRKSPGGHSEQRARFAAKAHACKGKSQVDFRECMRK